MTAEAERDALSKRVSAPGGQAVPPGPGLATPLTTPAGLDAIATLNRRRLGVLVANVGVWGLLMLWAGSILGAGGWTLVDALLFVCVALGTPWSVLGFTNAVIGFWSLHRRDGGLAATAPFLAGDAGFGPLTVNTAILMTLRNEDPERAMARLRTIKASLDRTGEGRHFSYFVLSDTDRDDIARREEVAVAAWQASDADRQRIVYRRRTENTGFKAGNVRDFARRWGDDFELMLLLDADSLMTGPAIVRLVRVMQSAPKIGILQSLVVGTPSSSAFARIFQFGMRLGMRCYTAGQAWWVGDCGPFWGHNALMRIKPYVDHCALPVLPGRPPLGGEILSHDQVEAVLMRRAGFEVRVMSVEDGSYEDNPPDLLAFLRRDTRWCQGNMQYVKLLGLRGIEPVSRFQLLWAILMFVGVPAWTLMIALTPLAAADAQSFAHFPTAAAKAFYIVVLLMHLSPKLAGVLDAILTPGEVARFGGPLRFAGGAALEILFSFLLGAVSAIRTSLFMAGLPSGAMIVWDGQARDGASVTWRGAALALWPQFLFGAAIWSALFATSPQMLLWSLPLTAGYLLAVPLTVVTADPAVGRYMRRHGIMGIPEDFAAPAEIRDVQSGAVRSGIGL